MNNRKRSSQSSPIEIFKDFLIIALLCSAAFLLWESQLLLGFSSRNIPTANIENSEYGLQVAAARPFRIATISGDNNALYGLQYDDEALDELFLLASGLLRETMSSLSEPISISEAEFRSLLQQAPGLYLDMAGEIPLSVLTGWLSNTSSPNHTDAPIRMLLTIYEHQLALCYQLSNNHFYICTTDVADPLKLTTLVEQTTPNGAQFAFQSEHLTDIDPYTMLSPSTPTPISYTASNPIASLESRELLLSLLNFNGQGTSIYTSTDGVGIVARSDTDILRISGNGIVTYEGEIGLSRYPIPHITDTPTTFDIVERCRSIASSALSPFYGDARLQLLRIEESDSATAVTFGFILNGSLIQYDDGGAAAQFIVKDDGVSSFTMRIRNYSATTEQTTLLPESQAIAAMSSLGYHRDDLILSYFDTGNATVSANWTAR